MKRNAFSLVELSIVLVILGLLVGGVIAGQSLICASELRSISADYSRYRAATMAFKDKYFAIPGDMATATSFWGSLGGTGSDTACQALSASGTTATCNGDGDGLLRNPNVGNTTIEYYRFWQHLSNAGLIEGAYTGYGTNVSRLVGINVPSTRLANVYFYAIPGLGYTTSTCCDSYAGTGNLFAGKYGRGNFYIGATNGTSTTSNSQPLAPGEAWNIDTKLDDGMPGTGIIIAFKGNGINTYCTTAAGIVPPGDVNATYLLSSALKDCTVYFTNAF